MQKTQIHHQEETEELSPSSSSSPSPSSMVMEGKGLGEITRGRRCARPAPGVLPPVVAASPSSPWPPKKKQTRQGGMRWDFCLVLEVRLGLRQRFC